MSTFSRRHGYVTLHGPISRREEAPEEFRYGVLMVAKEAGLSPSPQRQLLCEVLRRRPDPDNWSEYPNVQWEIEGLIRDCRWYKVYDYIEAIMRHLAKQNAGRETLVAFQQSVNELLVEYELGWKMEKGKIQYRGTEVFEHAVQAAHQTLARASRSTAAGELQEALRDLSRRPNPDRTGAIQHSMAALECVMRDLAGESGQTLGQVLKNHGGTLGIPAPLDIAVDKLWGYSSREGRHLVEGRDPSPAEAELVATVAASVVTYLLAKQG